MLTNSGILARTRKVRSHCSRHSETPGTTPPTLAETDLAIVIQTVEGLAPGKYKVGQILETLDMTDNEWKALRANVGTSRSCN